jgi:hypothetical protein
LSSRNVTWWARAAVAGDPWATQYGENRAVYFDRFRGPKPGREVTEDPLQTAA